MASGAVLKKLLSSNLLTGSIRSACVVSRPASCSRLFNTNAVHQYGNDDRELEGDRRLYSPFSGVFDPFSRRSSLSQVLNVMDRLMESPFSSTVHRNFNAKETAEGLHLRVDMPGLGKEDVNVSVEQNTLIIKGEGKSESEDGEDGGRKYNSRIDLPDRKYETNGIKAEMKNGVLKVYLPKIKEEDRAEVYTVNVQ